MFLFSYPLENVLERLTHQYPVTAPDRRFRRTVSSNLSVIFLSFVPILLVPPFLQTFLKKFGTQSFIFISKNIKTLLIKTIFLNKLLRIVESLFTLNARNSL